MSDKKKQISKHKYTSSSKKKSLFKSSGKKNSLKRRIGTMKIEGQLDFKQPFLSKQYTLGDQMDELDISFQPSLNT